MAESTTHHLYPPFPTDVATAPLHSISLRDLEASSPPHTTQESSKLFAACQNLGFFYLNLTESQLGQTIVAEVEELHVLQQKFYALSHETKDEYGMDRIVEHPFYSYRWTACADGVRDVWGREGRREMYNLRVDDILRIRPALPKHSMMLDAESLLSSFASHCRQVVRVLLSILETRLDLPPGSLLSLHKDTAPRGDFISLQHRAAEPIDQVTVQKGEHTDFGSITMLFNWLGGLQIRDQTVDGSGEWVYIKPIPGSCVINLADSLVKLTAGIFKSNIHRVAPAPGAQGSLPRFSLVYFAHPNDDVKLEPVKGGLVDAALDSKAENDEVVTAADWVVRRSLGDLRGVYTYKGGIELRDNHDAVAVRSSA